MLIRSVMNCTCVMLLRGVRNKKKHVYTRLIYAYIPMMCDQFEDKNHVTYDGIQSVIVITSIRKLTQVDESMFEQVFFNGFLVTNYIYHYVDVN